jgi:two-component system nitrate/nitrite response regulator NarL
MENAVQPIRVLLVDDHSLFRSGIRSLLQRHVDFTVVGEAADGVEGIKRCKQLKPDVVLLDLHMPGISGVATLHLLQQDCPGMAVIMLTVSEESEDLALAMRAGAQGYLIKNIETDYLLRAIRRAHAGEIVVAEALTGKLVAHMQSTPQVERPVSGIDKLTPREKDILACLALGESNKFIARKLDLAESTVKIHVQNVLKKLKLSSRVQAAVYAVEHRMAGATGEGHP